MLLRWFIFGLFILASAVSALGQSTAQPNHGADVATLEAPPTPTSTPAPASPGLSPRNPGVSSSSSKSSPAIPAHTPLVLAPAPAPASASTPDIPLDPKEKLPLGAPPASKTHDSAEKSSDNGSSSWMLTTVAALGAVVALILVLRAVISKLTGRAVTSSHSPVVEVLSRTTIAPRNQVVLLRLGRRILVVGDSSAGLNTLADIEDPEEVASLLTSVAASKPGSATAGFSGVLEGFDGEYDEELPARHVGRDRSEHRVDRARDSVRGLLSRLRYAGKGEA